VASGPEKPYYIAKKGMSKKGCFIRVGSATEPMPVRMIEDLFAKRTRSSIGKIVSPRQDLTFAQLKIYYEAQGLHLNENFAKNLELITENGKYNYVAYLMADENGTSIKLAKYSSLDRADLIENNEYGYCSLIKATNAVLDKLEIENKTFAQITSRRRIENRLWDAVAIREAVINAMVHNDYTREIPPKFEIFPDRLEITSYGGLFEGMSKNDFFSGLSLPKNKELMRIFKDLDMVEQLGSGVPRILKTYSKDSFVFGDSFTRMVFPLKTTVKTTTKTTMKTTVKILQLIKNNSKITREALAKEIGISIDGIDYNIKKLKKEGKLKRIGPDKGGYWQVME
jgi:ATP-dependent DNA helicase RecG